MKRLLLLLGMLCAFALPAYSQGQRSGDDRPVQSVQTPGGPIFSVPNATINFCNSPANGSPCTNKATTYTDITLTTACPTSQQLVLSGTNSCVATTDQYGNWGVWVPAGTYDYTIQLPTGGSMGPYTLTLPGSGGTNILPLPNIWTATNNFSAGLQIYGLTAAPFSGAATQLDCVNIFSISPLIFGDAGAPCGAGSGSGTVAPTPQYQLFAQPTAGTHATAQGVPQITTDASGDLNVSANASVTGTSTLTGNVSAGANVSILGPRPYVDVTAYGADPTNTADSTTAIQNAINAACTAQSAVFFPPGAYEVLQPQSSNAPILKPGSGCNNAGHGLYIIGGGSNGTSGSFVPQARIFVNAGASPGLGPLLALGASGQTNGVGSARIENMAFQCYNQCIQELSGGDMWFVNDNMTVDAPQTNCSSFGCTTDTTPIAFYAGLEFYFVGGVYINDNSPSGTNSSLAPSILLSTDSSNHSAGIVKFLNTYHFGPVVDSALSSPGSGWGTVYMDGDVFEALGSQSAFVSQNFGSAVAFDDLNMTNILVADSNPGITPIYLNGGTFYNGINVSVISPTTNAPATIEIANSGSLGNCFGGTVINSSAVSVPGCTSSTQGGLGFVGPSTYSNNPPVYYSSWWPNFNFSGSMLEMARAGEANTSLEIDPLMGDMFGPGGTVGGYDISLMRSGPQTLGLSLARALPPTVITATPAAGGSLTAGAHTYGVVSAVGASNCNTITNYYLTASMTASGGNLSALVGWTDPANTANITGYCVLRDPNKTAATQAIFVSGATATSYTDTGTGGTLASGPVINNTFPASPQYTFGITGATVPNLTVTGTCTNCGFPTGLTPGVIPQAGSSPPLVNSNPLLDNGNTTANTLTYAGSGGIAATKLTDSGLSSGNCVQAGTGGLLGTVSGPCSTGGTVTNVGTVAPLSGTVTTTGNLSCPTCVTASSPGAGIAHFAGSTQAVTSSAVNLASSDVTGITPVANGGTGTSSPALVAGTNVTITGSWPNQTINSSGGGGSSFRAGMTTNGMAYFTSLD